jgi:hypothetical protein
LIPKRKHTGWRLHPLAEGKPLNRGKPSRNPFDEAIMEAITGQVYLAIFIARLVGLHIAHELMRKTS